ncbi:thiamine monophosphate kinase [Paenibacillus sp. V4I3]|uniref:hypothetical protein n=1 Tax=Paenibacillus sp. V4I3 TaxID=3042305 RepID=UPI0027860A57|nr:hypothetical protein [Paenibacillus sp. V4I3]MDQ0878906.1 thiamine monophosphate kinase [Paenibacillus sp. V4I3]
MVNQNDWRLMGQEDYLLGATLFWQEYKPYSSSWDHDHCVFCFGKFKDGDKGYSTADKNHWICLECFDDFKGKFQWQVGD